MKFPKIDFKYLVLLTIAVVNVSATAYIDKRPELENKLFELYLASVTGLYGLALQPSFNGGYGGNGDRNNNNGNDDGNF